MPRQKGTPNTPQKIIDEIVRKHREGESIKSLVEKYNKPFKTIKTCVQGKTISYATIIFQNSEEENPRRLYKNINMKISD